ncbi:MAG: TAXI family TRAP transporter solute-binding subunit [Wohlfahrtiimonas sp.]
MVFRYFLSFILIFSNLFIANSQELRSITVGYSDALGITKEATNMVCFGFEADHPANHCKSEYIDSEVMWEQLMNNEIQVALMPEEVLIANQKKRPQPLIIAPLYQQYLILIGNHDVSMESVQSFRDRTIGVTDWATKEYRGKPLSLALGLKEQDVYFPIANTRDQLSELFCSFAIDGIMIMSDPSSPLARELTTSCDGQIMSFTDQQIQQVMRSSLGLYPAIIPKEMFWRAKEDIKTLRSRVFLVVNPKKNIANNILESLDHIKDEINLTTLRTHITAKSILETYDIKPIKLHPDGENLMNVLREEQNSIKEAEATANPLLVQSPDESLHENLVLPR